MVRTIAYPPAEKLTEKEIVKKWKSIHSEIKAIIENRNADDNDNDSYDDDDDDDIDDDNDNNVLSPKPKTKGYRKTRHGNFEATISFKGKNRSIGTFKYERDAALAFKIAKKKKVHMKVNANTNSKNMNTMNTNTMNDNMNTNTMNTNTMNDNMNTNTMNTNTMNDNMNTNTMNTNTMNDNTNTNTMNTNTMNNNTNNTNNNMNNNMNMMNNYYMNNYYMNMMNNYYMNNYYMNMMNNYYMNNYYMNTNVNTNNNMNNNNNNMNSNYFDELLAVGMLKKIEKHYCQNNRDKARMKNSINPSKKIILDQQLDLELVNKGSYHRRAKVYYAANHGYIVKAQSVRTSLSEATIRADPTKRFIGILPNNSILYVRYNVLKKGMDSDGYNYVKLNNSIERVGCIIQATFSGINRPYGNTLDHENGFRHDDRFSNTRWVTSKVQRANQRNRTNMMNRVVNPPIPFKTMEDADCEFKKHPELDIYVSDSIPTYFYNNKIKRFVHGYHDGKYHRININGKLYRSGRLSYEAITGTMLQPLELVDHVTGDTTNDSSGNIRKTHACGNMLNHKHRRAGTIRPYTTVAPRRLAANGLPMCETLQSGISFLRKLNGEPMSRPYRMYTQIGPPNKRTKYQARFETKEDAVQHYDMVYSENSVPYLPKEYQMNERTNVPPTDVATAPLESLANADAGNTTDRRGVNARCDIPGCKCTNQLYKCRNNNNNCKKYVHHHPCGMTNSLYDPDNEQYVFCSESCRELFKINPHQKGS